MIFLPKWVILRWTIPIFRGVKDLKATTWRLLFEPRSELSSFFGPAAISRWRSCTSGEWQQRQSTSLCWTWKLTTMPSREHVKFCRKYQRQFNKQERERERDCDYVRGCVCVCAVLTYLYVQYRFREYPCCASLKLYICNCTSPYDSMIFLLVAFFISCVSKCTQLRVIKRCTCMVILMDLPFKMHCLGWQHNDVEGWYANKKSHAKKAGPPEKILCFLHLRRLKKGWHKIAFNFRLLNV